MATIFTNNKLISAEAHAVTYNHRAFKYGDGVFETIKVSQSVPLFLKHHYSRLVLALNFFEFEIPEFWTYSFFVRHCLDLIKDNNIVYGNLRIQVSRLGGGKYLPTSNGCDLLMEVQPITQTTYVLSEKPAKLGLFTKMTKALEQASNYKTLNSNVYIQAAIFKEREQFNEVIVLNQNGRVADASASNVFIAVNNLLLVPPSNEGGVDGVLRRVLVKLCKQHKIDLQVVPISQTDLKDASEIFTTNVIKGIQPISEFEGKALNNIFAQKLITLLINKEQKEIESLRQFIY